MHMQGIHEILHQSLELGLPFLLVLEHGAPQAFGYYPDLTLFPLFPHPVRYVKQYALEEEHERHPLVVRVVPLLAVVAAQARMGHVGANRVRQSLRHRVGRCDPAERVDYIFSHPLRQAIDRFTYKWTRTVSPQSIAICNRLFDDFY